MRTTHLIILTMAAVSLMGCNPKETVNALTSDQNVTQKMAVRFAENMVGLPRALVVSDARKAAPGDKVTVKGAVIGDDPVFFKKHCFLHHRRPGSAPGQYEGEGSLGRRYGTGGNTEK